MSELFQFAIDSVKVEQFAIFESNFDKNKNIEMEIGFDFQSNAEAKTIVCVAKVQFFADDQLFIILHFAINYKIQKESWSRLEITDGIHLNVDFARHLAMVVIGSARGYLFSKLEGTALSNYIIPTINIHQIIRKDFEMK